jgi:glycine/D-amino acid oxidase-like deaminating enzyme
MKLTSYWLETSQPFDGGSSKPLEGRYDVAVVGGGLTGSSAALALAKKGARVAVLEAETVGNAASGRTGGSATTALPRTMRSLPASTARMPRTRSTRPSTPASIEQLVEELDCSFARVGKLKLAAKPEHYDYSMGYSGHGTHMSTLMGSVIAEVMDGRPDLNPWNDFDGQRSPVVSGGPGSCRSSGPITA